MHNTKAISDEEIIAALLQHGTIKEAAAAAGTTPRTIYDRMNNINFRAQYAEAKNDILRGAIASLNKKLSAALDTVFDIMTNPDVNPATRLQAAQTIIKTSERFSIRLSNDETQSYHQRNPIDFSLL